MVERSRSRSVANAVQVIDRVTGRPLGPRVWGSRNTRRCRPRWPSAPMAGTWPWANPTISSRASAGLRWLGRRERRTPFRDRFARPDITSTRSPGAPTARPSPPVVDEMGRFWDAAAGATKGPPRTMSSPAPCFSIAPMGGPWRWWPRRGRRFSAPRASVCWTAGRARRWGPEWAFETGVRYLAFSPDGGDIAVGLCDGTTEIRGLPRANPPGKPLDILGSTPTAFDGQPKVGSQLARAGVRCG